VQRGAKPLNGEIAALCHPFFQADAAFQFRQRFATYDKIKWNVQRRGRRTIKLNGTYSDRGDVR